MRQLNQLTSWLVFCPISSILVVSQTKSTNSLFLFHLKNGNIYKLPKIEVDHQQQNSKIEVKEKDIQGRFCYQFIFAISYVNMVNSFPKISFIECLLLG